MRNIERWCWICIYPAQQNMRLSDNTTALLSWWKLVQVFQAIRERKSTVVTVTVVTVTVVAVVTVTVLAVVTITITAVVTVIVMAVVTVTVVAVVTVTVVAVVTVTFTVVTAGYLDDGVGELHALQQDRVLLITQRLSSDHILQASQSDNVSSASNLHIPHAR